MKPETAVLIRKGDEYKRAAFLALGIMEWLPSDEEGKPLNPPAGSFLCHWRCKVPEGWEAVG